MQADPMRARARHEAEALILEHGSFRSPDVLERLAHDLERVGTSADPELRRMVVADIRRRAAELRSRR